VGWTDAQRRASAKRREVKAEHKRVTDALRRPGAHSSAPPYRPRSIRASQQRGTTNQALGRVREIEREVEAIEESGKPTWSARPGTGQHQLWSDLREWRVEVRQLTRRLNANALARVRPGMTDEELDAEPRRTPQQIARRAASEWTLGEVEDLLDQRGVDAAIEELGLGDEITLDALLTLLENEAPDLLDDEDDVAPREGEAERAWRAADEGRRLRDRIDRLLARRPPRWTHERALEALAGFREEHGRWPLKRELGGAAGLPSYDTVRRLFGGLPAACEVAARDPFLTAPDYPHPAHLQAGLMATSGTIKGCK
jgi:hypothetical protein